MSKHILMVVGSLRKESFNRQLAKEVAALLQGDAEVKFLEYEDIPYMNQDIEYPAPEAIIRVREEFKNADGIWIFTPEYNGKISGVLKNLLDWMSRPIVPGDFNGNTALYQKAVTYSGAGGRAATAGALKELDELCAFGVMNIMSEPSTGVVIPGESFGTGKLTLSQEDKNNLSKQAKAFVDFLNK